jgi:ABC-type amino acid transport substrate-binding protein
VRNGIRQTIWCITNVVALARHRRYGIIASLLLILSSLCTSVEGEDGSLKRIGKTKRITVITRNNAHCYYMYREERMGFEYDLARAFAGHLGVDLKVKTLPWIDMIKAVNEGKGDFIAASKTITPSRRKLVDFSDEYLSVQQRVVVHEHNHSINHLADLNGKTVHVRRATSYAERLSELQKQGLEFIMWDPDTFRALKALPGKRNSTPTNGHLSKRPCSSCVTRNT